MKKIITFCLLFCLTISFAQLKLKKADKLFNELKYVEAAQAYEAYLEKEPNPSTEAVAHIADTYYFLDKPREALAWYRKLYELQGQTLSDLYLIRYTQSLRGVRDYEKADEITKSELLKKKDEKEASHFMNQKRYNDSLSSQPSLYKIKAVAVNSSKSDFGTTFYGNQLVYSSAKDTTKFHEKLYSWNQQPFLELYVADRNISTGELFNEMPFLEDIRSQYHDATVTFTPDLKTIYYTTNTLKKRKLLNDKEGVNNFQILRANIQDGKASEPEKMFFNSLDFSVGHPSLSQDGKWLFFVSDMPGGYGETDIYVAEVFSDGKLNTPQNLGPAINTAGREMFPFYLDKTLYFSSDGHYGYGGLDVFESKQNGKLIFSEPKNLGEPLNSNKDDFSFVMEPESKYGYFSSNRDTGKGDDDIYYFTKAKAPCDQLVSGKVIASKTKLSLDGVIIKVFDSFGDYKTEVTTLANGDYLVTIPCGGAYRLEASKPSYISQEKTVTTGTKNLEEIKGVNFELANLDDFTVIEDNKKKVDINPIFFEYDKWGITPQAVIELDKVVYVMSNFPKVKIKIESHTDSRGKDSYNMNLSDKRAKSTRDYILSKGIDPGRIESAIGYGEKRLRNKCSNGVKCTEEEHLLNRRSDFIIIEE
ncbi:OmpA family protein [Flavobacterium sp.]|uniref:OmpA family protein n=1 Tax=Flavobacterium sp. TaxID=239 RepID=UPI003D6A912A